MYRLGFIVERALGHTTHGQNLQQFITQDPSVEAHWGFPSWEARGWAGRLPALGGNWTVQAGLQARRQVAAMQRLAPPQALFFHTQVTAVLARDWLRRVPSVVSLDATPKQYDALGAHYAHATGPAWLEGIKERLNRACFQQARRIVTWSAWAKQGVVEGYGVPAERVTVIPPGVSTAAWANGQREGPTGQPVRILFVGGDFERKGGPQLLAAFQALRAAGAAVELHLVTQAALPSEAGVFVHAGLRPNSAELRQLYHAADIFCLPTLGDCLPVVLAEAGAARLPLVATQLAAIPEMVRPGQTGLLVPPGDVGALTAALRHLVDSPELRLLLGAGAQQLSRRAFDAEANAGKVVRLLKDLADEAGGSTAP